MSYDSYTNSRLPVLDQWKLESSTSVSSTKADLSPIIERVTPRLRSSFPTTE